jgi:hypothetical protein
MALAICCPKRALLCMIRAQGHTVQQQATDVELRLAELQTQIDRLSVALHQWHGAPDDGPPAQEQLSQLLERCNQALSRVAEIDDRHSKTAAQLEERLKDWSFVEARLEQDSDKRIRQFEQIIEHEWQALRKLHEDPARQLREQAASLGETCIAAANLALRGFERAEARIAELEAGLQGRMTQLAGELQAAVAELRRASGLPPASLPPDVSPFPLDSVMRIHQELRRTTTDDAALPDNQAPLPQDASAAPAPKAILELPAAPSDVGGRLGSPGRGVSGSESVRFTTARKESTPRDRRTALVAGAGIIGAILMVLWLQYRADARLDEAELRATTAERQTDAANQQLVETREDAARRLAEARETALRAQIMTDVLAAPDLVRFNLGGGPAAPRAYAQVLWSRSRGLVFSGARLPPLGQGTTYQLWLLTSGAPVSAGVFAPDSAGRATLATDTPPNIPPPIRSAVVTLEPSGGRPRPTGEAVLARPE